MYAYLGCRTTRERNARGAGISVFKVDPASARLELAQVLEGLVNPSYLALNARGDRLYAVHGDTTGISAYVVDQGDGRIRPLNRQDTGGLNPVHLAIDPTGRHVIVSNHIGASVAVLPIGADGELGPASQLLPLEGTPGPHRIEQKQAKPHANPFAPDGRHVIVPDKGLDRIFSFRWTDGLLTAAASPVAVAREGAGPRHLAFHPAASHAYCVNELDSTVTVYRYDAASGALEPMQILPSVPDTHTGNNRAAAILVDARGERVYVSNRGHDSIAAFRVDAASGRLSWIGAVASGGRTPRSMALMPGGDWLYALNEESDSIVAFRVDAASGALARMPGETRTGSPVCMVFGGAQA